MELFESIVEKPSWLNKMRRESKIWKYFATSTAEIWQGCLTTHIIWLIFVKHIMNKERTTFRNGPAVYKIDESPKALPYGPVSVIRFLSRFKKVCDKNSMHEGAAMWLVSQFMKQRAVTELTERLSLNPKSFRTKTEEGKISTHNRFWVPFWKCTPATT